MKNYSDLWKLNSNSAKHILEVTDQSKYLVLISSFNSKFTEAKKLLYDKGTRAMFALLRRGRQLQLLLPLYIMIHLFHTLVKHVLLYGSES